MARGREVERSSRQNVLARVLRPLHDDEAVARIDQRKSNFTAHFSALSK